MACDQSRLRLAAEEQKPEAKKEKKNEDEDEERRLVEKRIHDLQKERCRLAKGPLEANLTEMLHTLRTPDVTLIQFKECLAGRLGVSVDQFFLIHTGKKITTKTLRSAGVTDGSNLYVHLTMPEYK